MTIDQTFPAHWNAQWIEPPEASDLPDVQRPAYHLATDFQIADAVAAATLYVTAHGVVEVFVNGTRVGDQELTPGFTAYRTRLQVHSFDVTALLLPGANCVGALLSDGWWRGQHGIARQSNSYGTTVALLAELHVTFSSGSSIVIATDGDWRAMPSHITGADLVAGENHDMRLVVDGWALAGSDRSTWSPALTVDHGFDTLCDPIGPPSRRIQELAAVSVTQIGPESHVVDFGQNSHGWIRLSDLGPAGTVLTITHGEALAPDGTVTQSNIAGSQFAPKSRLEVPFQRDAVTSAGDGSIFEPRHSTKGFQFVQIDGHPGPLDPASIVSVVVHSDLTRIGDFTCSDDRINRLHVAADWSFRGNACEIPTDCPTRERSGWTGDWQLYISTAAYLYDVTDFSTKWLRDLAAEQRPNGAVLHIVPDPHHFTATDRDWWDDMQGSAGWGDAACHVPYEMYLASGRTDFISPQIDSMQRWVDFAAQRAATGRYPSRAEARPEPLPHEKFIWDSGFHFGEWLEPGIDLGAALASISTTDHGSTATAYFYRSARELSELAALVGDAETADRYGSLAGNILDAWRLEFIDADGHVQPAKQGNLVRALAFGLVPDDQRAVAARDLVALIRAAGDHLGTGFLATPFILPVLADNGYLDVAYELLFQNTEPSWLAMIDRGATTIWEQWEAMKSDGTVEASLNHYSKGAVISFLHRYTAGLQIVSPGYQSFRVAPQPGGGITSASTYHDSPYGRIEVSWSILDGVGTLEVVVPAGSAAELVLPDGTTSSVAEGRHLATWVTRVGHRV